MLFQRRTAQTALQKLRNLIWPQMGWRRVMDYYKHRTVRIPASEYSIAAGLAFGCSISWTPAFGTHLLQCMIFCWIARANWIASFIGSALGNPWTTPALMFISYHVGKALFISTGHGTLITPETEQTFGTFLKTILDGDANWEFCLNPISSSYFYLVLRLAPWDFHILVISYILSKIFVSINKQQRDCVPCAY
jgi:uncharacterized protein (DUF2062 family)